MPEHHLVFGVSLRLALLSSPDRRSTWDRRSPVNRFSSSERVSFPDRLSLVVRLSLPDRFPSSPIAYLRWLSRIKLDGAGYRWLQARERAARGLKIGLSERHLYQSLPCSTAQLSRSTGRFQLDHLAAVPQVGPLNAAFIDSSPCKYFAISEDICGFYRSFQARTDYAIETSRRGGRDNDRSHVDRSLPINS